VGSYIQAHTPDQVLPDFNQPEADIRTERVVGSDGKPREVLNLYRCAVLGQALIIEFAKGGGGSAHLGAVLVELLRKYVNEKLPSVELFDVSTRDLEKVIQHGGGVDSMTAKVIRSAKVDGFFGSRLSDLRKRVPNASTLQVTWESSDGALDPEAALAALQEADEESILDSVVLKLKDGQSIDRLGRYKERRRITVDVRNGKVAASQVESALWNYLDELRIPDRKTRWRLLDDDGIFIAPLVLSSKGN
jgi:hypothetical protein